jgi:transposase
MSMRVTPCARENRGWLPADADDAWCRWARIGVWRWEPCQGPALLPRARDSASDVPSGSRGQPPVICPRKGSMVMEEVTDEPAELVERVAALDIGKASLVCCVRVPHESKPGGRRQEVRTCGTVTPALLELRDWLICQGVTRVVMEATSAYWKPPFYLLEDDIECWVVNARDVKNVPGRPKTDKLDSVWLCKLAERGMLRPSFIPARPQRQLRDLTRYRRTLTQERSREKQRAEKLLEDCRCRKPMPPGDIRG